MVLGDFASIFAFATFAVKPLTFSKLSQILNRKGREERRKGRRGVVGKDEASGPCSRIQ